MSAPQPTDKEPLSASAPNTNPLLTPVPTPKDPGSRSGCDWSDAARCWFFVFDGTNALFVKLMHDWLRSYKHHAIPHQAGNGSGNGNAGTVDRGKQRQAAAGSKAGSKAVGGSCMAVPALPPREVGQIGIGWALIGQPIAPLFFPGLSPASSNSSSVLLFLCLKSVGSVLFRAVAMEKPPARASIGSMCYYVRKLFQVASRLCIIPAARDLETITDCPADSTRRCMVAPHGSAEHQSSGKLEWDPLSGIDPLSGPPVTPLLQHYSSIPGRPHVEDQEKPLAQCQLAWDDGLFPRSKANQ